MNIHCISRSFRSLALISALPALLSACGQYGDLYLPEKPSGQAQPAEQPPEAPPDQTDQPVEE